MGYMPVHCAASGGSLALVKYFIEFGVDVNAKTKASIIKSISLCYFMLALNCCKEW